MLLGKFSSGAEVLIVGLGNPGKKYERTRHNVGFMAADALCQKHSISCTKHKFEGVYGLGTIAGTRCAVLKPQTFMNLSGQSVGPAMRFFKIPPAKVIVIFDDISLPVGKIRIRRDGSHGGHNGMRNISDYCGGEGFPRVKIGVGGKPYENMDLSDHVLGAFTSAELTVISEMVDRTVSAVEAILREDIEKAMAQFN